MRTAIACLFLLSPIFASTAFAQSDLPTLGPVEMTYQGVAAPIKQIMVKAPLDGIVAKVLVEEGQKVEAGQLLIHLDDALQALAVEGARLRAIDESELTQAKLALEDAQLKYDQAQELYGKGAMSTFELQQARLRRDVAQAQIGAAESNRKLAQANLSLEQEKLKRYQLTAAFAGRILVLNTEEGSNITQEDQLLLLVALDKLEAKLHLPISIFGQLEVGKQYRLEAEEPVNREVTATLVNVDRVIDSASRTFRCTFTIDNADEKLPAGFMARLVWPQE